MVGASRVYLGVHYLTDVVSGISLGAAWALLLAGFFTLVGPSWFVLSAFSRRSTPYPLRFAFRYAFQQLIEQLCRFGLFFLGGLFAEAGGFRSI